MNFWELFQGFSFSPSEKATIQREMDKLEAFEKKHNLHPVLRLVLHMSVSEDAESFQSPLPDAALERAAVEVERAYRRKPEEGAWAVYSLMQLGLLFNHELKLMEASHQLLTLCNNLILQYDLMSLVDGTETTRARDDAEERVGNRAERKAPEVGATAPGGSMKIDRLNFPRRL